MELVSHTDKILRTPCEKFDFSNPPFDPIEFAHELVKFMYDKNGLGLASPQVGTPYQIFAMRGHPENFVVFNPRIIDKSEEEILLAEGCLSFPGMTLNIKRPRRIKVRFSTPNGESRTEEFHDLSARIFEHEVNHLQGVCFTDIVGRIKLEKAIKNTNFTLKDFKHENGNDN